MSSLVTDFRGKQNREARRGEKCELVLLANGPIRFCAIGWGDQPTVGKASASVPAPEPLRNGSHRNGLDVGRRKLKSQGPFARDVLAIDFRRRKFPLSRGLRSKIGEILARPGRIVRGLHHTASRINTA